MSYRRAPNVSAYLENLNTAPTPQEVADQQHLDLSTAGDLDFLASAEFFDFDQFNHTAPVYPTEDKNAQPFPGFDQFSAFPGTAVTSPSTIPSPHDTLQGIYPTQPQHHFSTPLPGGHVKRKASVAALPTAEHLEESSRAAAEEDKRRRNTAASARFRVKKKQREQALEKQTKDMADKVQALENKVSQLEQENKWLKGLITEKKNAVSSDLESGLAKREAVERSQGNRDDGVGTEDVKA